MTIKLATSCRNARLNALRDFAGSGALVRIYTGAQPAVGGAAITTETLLGTLICDAPLAPDAVGGVLALGTVTSDADADADGDAGWFRMVKSDGVTWVMDGSAGALSTDMIVTPATVTLGDTIACETFTITDGNSAT